MEQERIAEEEAREKEIVGDVKEEEPPRKFAVKGYSEALVDLDKLLTEFENADPALKGFR